MGLKIVLRNFYCVAHPIIISSGEGEHFFIPLFANSSV